MTIGNIIETSVRMYFKNIIVNLFFSALIILLPYLQYILIKSDIDHTLCTALVFITAFLSVGLVYIPFVVSIRSGRITQLWRKLCRRMLPTAFVWALICASLFLAIYFITNNIQNPFLLLLALVGIIFFLWELVILKCINIVSNAENEIYKRTSLLPVLMWNLFSSIKVLVFGIIFFFLAPIASNAFLNRRMLYPNAQASNEQEFEMGSSIFSIFLIFPFLVIFLNSFFNELTVE